MTSPFDAENAASRRRLEEFVNGLSDADLTRPTPYGGTVAALLAHLAFWDRRVAVLVRRWRASGIDDSPVDADLINDALAPLNAALDPRAAAALCLAAAAEADAEVEALSPDFIAAVEAHPVYIRLDRSLHRRGHLEDLARVVGVGSG
jgi:hypothetical protein